ncbi:MAG: hypothetical protein EXR93_07225 [Gemmatimonadetes bacterium]|nr:hypothetical protein [Gemmatimonadota bacterium]
MIFVLRLAHILAGAFWFGAFLFVARVLMPSLKAAGPGAGPVMAQLGQKIPRVMMSAAAVTILSGFWLMWVVSGGAPEMWMKSGFGRTIGLGAASSILALTLGMIINVPASKRLAVLNQGAAKRGGAPTAEEAAETQRLMARLGMGTMVAGTFLFIAMAAMAVARYVL